MLEKYYKVLSKYGNMSPKKPYIPFVTFFWSLGCEIFPQKNHHWKVYQVLVLSGFANCLEAEPGFGFATFCHHWERVVLVLVGLANTGKAC